MADEEIRKSLARILGEAKWLKAIGEKARDSRAIGISWYLEDAVTEAMAKASIDLSTVKAVRARPAAEPKEKKEGRGSLVFDRLARKLVKLKLNGESNLNLRDAWREAGGDPKNKKPARTAALILASVAYQAERIRLGKVDKSRLRKSDLKFLKSLPPTEELIKIFGVSEKELAAFRMGAGRFKGKHKTPLPQEAEARTEAAPLPSLKSETTPPEVKTPLRLIPPLEQPSVRDEKRAQLPPLSPAQCAIYWAAFCRGKMTLNPPYIAERTDGRVKTEEVKTLFQKGWYRLEHVLHKQIDPNTMEEQERILRQQVFSRYSGRNTVGELVKAASHAELFKHGIDLVDFIMRTHGRPCRSDAIEQARLAARTGHYRLTPGSKGMSRK